MSLNRANMLVDTNSPKLARADINDMFADLGYSTIGNVSPITTTGGANKLFKFSAIANTILHFLRIRKSSTTALSVQDDSSVDVLNVDSINKIVTSYNQKITGLAGTGSRMVVADSTGNLSAKIRQITSVTVTDVDTEVGVVTEISSEQIIRITGSVGHVVTFIVCPNYYAGSDIKFGVFGYAVETISTGNRFSFRLGGETMEIYFPVIGGVIKLRRQTPGSTNVTFDMREM